MMSEKYNTSQKTCCKMLYSNLYADRKRSNAAKVMHDGKPYCGLHDPAKRIARDAANKAKWDSKREHMESIAARNPRLLANLKKRGIVAPKKKAIARAEPPHIGMLKLPEVIEFPFALPSRNSGTGSLNWRTISAKAKALREKCYYALIEWWGWQCQGQVDISITVYSTPTKGIKRGATRDSSNVEDKPAIDALRDAGILKDDSMEFVRWVNRRALKGTARTIIEIRRAE